MDFRKRVKQIELKCLVKNRQNVIVIDDVVDFILFCNGKFEGKEVVFDEEFERLLFKAVSEADEMTKQSSSHREKG